MSGEVWRGPSAADLQGPHRFAEFFRDMPILDGGNALYLDDAQRDRLGCHAEACGLRKTAPRQIKYWPSPRGQSGWGNAGLWVPADTPDPPELATPDPAAMTPAERQVLRAQLAAFDDDEGDDDA